jgi:hypothetical protein
MLTTLPEYLDLILKLDRPQTNLFKADKFLDFLKRKDISINKDDLEYYDKKDVIRPILRLHKPLSNEWPLRYSTVDISICGLKEYYKMGLAEFPVADDFQPWKNYIDDHEEKVLQFYHPFQLISIRFSILDNYIPLRATSLESSNPENFKSLMDRLKHQSSKLMEASYKRSKEVIPKTGLLMLLGEIYGPLVKRMRIQHDISNLYKWYKWTSNKFSPKEILEFTGMSIEDIKGLYDYLCERAYHIDPLGNWFPLLQLMKVSAIGKLEGKALLSQDYYTLAYVLSNFIYQLTGEKMLDPDDMNDGTMGVWKKKIYGDPFDYDSRKTRNIILDNYLANRPFRLILVVEGDTEETIINLILEALAIDPDRDGFIIHNLRGQSNIKINLGTIYYLASKDFIDVFTILDNDHEADEIITRFNIGTERYHKWERDFEYDNFGVEAVVKYVNFELKQRGLRQISKNEVEKELSDTNKAMMNIVDILIARENRMKYEISKKLMCKSLILDRVTEIKEARKREKNWEPWFPIEHILKKVFGIFPELSFASTTVFG